MKIYLHLAVCFCLTINAGKAQDLDETIEGKIDSLMSLMTLEEKIGQMNQYNGFWNVTGPAPQEGDAANKYEHLKKGWVGSMLNVRGVKEVRKVQKIVVEQSRLGIPLIIGFDAIHGYKTQSPIPLAESASWDMEAIKASAAMSAEESAAAGINWTFAPMVDISRDARWGRVMEGGGEDPYLASKIAFARVKGFQGSDLSAINTIAACAKHFAGYGFSEAGRDYNTVDVGISTLYNTILPPFMAAIDADVKTFMNSFNELNGIPATGNAYLQRDILKKEWNYQGFMVSDWGSMVEMVNHGYSKDGKAAAESAANAGSDMDMESYLYVKHLKNLVDEGKVSADKIDDAARRILRVKFELGLFDDPYKYCNEEREKAVIGSNKNLETALDMAKKSIVLLKNEQQLLPLKKEGLKIAVIGPLADDKNSPLGGWRLAADDNTAVSVLEGLKNYKGNTLSHEKGVEFVKGQEAFVFELDINTTNRKGINEAVEVAKINDVVVMVLGEHGFQSGEGRSRTSLDLPGLQQELLEAVHAVNKNIVLVLMNGRPLTINWADDNIPAIVEAWQLGTRSGDAIAQVLYGDYNPSGKLPMTFPRSVGQIPLYYNYKSTGRPNDPGSKLVFWTHYTDEVNTPLYEFGYGLSYTNFKYDNIQLSADTMPKTGDIKVNFNLTNTGKFEGKEVVQLYIQDLFASTTRPVKELKDFQIISLKPGESKNVSFTIDAKTLQFYSANNVWETELGDFKVYIGGSSNTTLESKFTLKD